MLAGGLMFASLRLDAPSFPVLLIAAALVLATMFAALFWPPHSSASKRTVR